MGTPQPEKHSRVQVHANREPEIRPKHAILGRSTYLVCKPQIRLLGLSLSRVPINPRGHILPCCGSDCENGSNSTLVRRIESILPRIYYIGPIEGEQRANDVPEGGSQDRRYRSTRRLHRNPAMYVAGVKRACGLLENAMQAHGVAKGDRVAVVASNSFDTLTVFFAVTSLGGILHLRRQIWALAVCWIDCIRSSRSISSLTTRQCTMRRRSICGPR